MSKVLSIFCLAAALWFGGSNAIGQESVPIVDIKAPLTPDNLFAAEGDLRVLAGKLTAILKKKYDGHMRYIEPAGFDFAAVQLLGRISNEQAAELFVANIGVMSTARSPFSSAGRDLTYYPFAQALIQTGALAISDLRKVILSESMGTARFELSCLVVRRVLGEEVAFAWLEEVFPNRKEDPRRIRIDQLFRLDPIRWQTPDKEYTGKE